MYSQVYTTCQMLWKLFLNIFLMSLCKTEQLSLLLALSTKVINTDLWCPLVKIPSSISGKVFFFLQIQFIRFITVYLSLKMKTGHLKSMPQQSKPADRMIFESTHQLHCPVHCSLLEIPTPAGKSFTKSRGFKVKLSFISCSHEFDYDSSIVNWSL